MFVGDAFRVHFVVFCCALRPIILINIHATYFTGTMASLLQLKQLPQEEGNHHSSDRVKISLQNVQKIYRKLQILKSIWAMFVYCLHVPCSKANIKIWLYIVIFVTKGLWPWASMQWDITIFGVEPFIFATVYRWGLALNHSMSIDSSIIACWLNKLLIKS